VVSSNSTLEQLIKEIHAMVTTGKAGLKTHESMDTCIADREVALHSIVADHKTTHRIASSHASIIKPSTATHITAETPPKGLPSSIVSLNAKRQASAMKTMAENKEKPSEKPSPRQPPYFTVVKTTTIAELVQGLDHIFSRVSDVNSGPIDDVIMARIKDIGLWTQSLDNLLDSRISKSKPAKQQNDLVDILIHLNEAIENTHGAMRGLFYNFSTTAQIDRVLDKLLTVTNSVRATKEVEEFRDTREEWKEEHQNK
jgi:hypothetical protein